MKPTELRIGNVFIDNLTKNALLVIGITQDEINFFNPKGEKLPDGWQAKPIPLTESILLQCGFEHDKDSNEFTIETNVFTIIKLRLGVDLRERFEFMSHDFNPNLDYLHQLQNLYFALVGKELPIDINTLKI